MASKLERRWTVHLVHHTHVDIGYTHTQDVVLRKQFAHLERAMELCEESRDETDEARFRWNPEVNWAVLPWLRQADGASRDRFAGLVREGLIGLDALYGNLLTGLCRPEELLDALEGKRELEGLTGQPIDSAMITDIPGWNWGLVTALSEYGVRYLSAGTNPGDRIGTILRKLGDKPFYWVSPSGKERVLVLVHGKGYAWFHNPIHLSSAEGIDSRQTVNRLTPARILAYLRDLERSGYPFDQVILRYNIGADNGPPDSLLSRRVREWNESVEGVRLVTSTTSRAMRAFEESFGATLPEFRGDLTGYWEDGAASTARETAIAREASERLSQAADLRAMTGASPEAEAFRLAREEVLLYDEHTWGAYNSMSRPDGEFARRQWDWKRQRALEAASATASLLGPLAYPETQSGLLGDGGRSLSRLPLTRDARTFTVYNTHSWPAGGVVTLHAAGSFAFDASGAPLPSQRLSTGRLAVLLPPLPPFGSALIRIREEDEVRALEKNASSELPPPGNPRLTGTPHPDGRGGEAASLHLSEGRYRLAAAGLVLEVDAGSGDVASLAMAGRELAGAGFNGYSQVLGRHPGRMRKSRGSKANVSLLDCGPLVSTLRIERKAPGAKRLVTEYSLRAGEPRLRVSNLLDRPRSRKPEALFFSFPFAVPGAIVRYDSAFGVARAELDQLPGACRNYLTANRWADVSNDAMGATLALLDAPLFQTGGIHTDAKRVGWLDRLGPDSTFHSYVMNNYWGTNYKADQPGTSLFRYVVSPHGRLDEVAAWRFALEEAQPLLVLEGEALPSPFPLSLSDSPILVTSLRRKASGLELRFFNPSDKEARVELGSAESVDPVASRQAASHPAAWLRVLSPGKDGRLVGLKLSLAPRETILLGISQSGD